MLARTAVASLHGTNVYSPYGPAASPQVSTQGEENLRPHENLHMKVYTGFTYNLFVTSQTGHVPNTDHPVHG